MMYNPEEVRSRMQHIEENYYGLHPKPPEPKHRGQFVEIERELIDTGVLGVFNVDKPQTKEEIDRDGEKGPIFRILDQHKVQQTSEEHPKEGYYLPPQPGRPVILAFHGNGGNAALHFADNLRFAVENGYGLYCPEYNSYAKKNPEKATARNLEKDADRAAKFLEDQGIAHSQTLIFGQCLGSAPAIHLAKENSTHKKQEPYIGLLVDCPMASSKQLVKEAVEKLVADKELKLPPGIRAGTVAKMLASEHHIENEKNMQSVSIPTTVVMSPNDDLVPTHHHQKVFNALPERTRRNSISYITDNPGHIAATYEEMSDQLNLRIYQGDVSKFQVKNISRMALTPENREQMMQQALDQYKERIGNLSSRDQDLILSRGADYFNNNFEMLSVATDKHGNPSWNKMLTRELDRAKEDITIGKLRDDLVRLPQPTTTLDHYLINNFKGQAYKVEQVRETATKAMIDTFQTTNPIVINYMLDRFAEKMSEPGMKSMMTMFPFMFEINLKTGIKDTIEAVKKELNALPVLESQSKAEEVVGEKRKQPIPIKKSKYEEIAKQVIDQAGLSEVLTKQDQLAIGKKITAFIEKADKQQQEGRLHPRFKLYTEDGQKAKDYDKQLANIARERIEKILPPALEMSATQKLLEKETQKSIEKLGVSEERGRLLQDKIVDRVSQKIQAQREGKGNSPHKIFDDSLHRKPNFQKEIAALVKDEVREYKITKQVKRTINKVLKENNLNFTDEEKKDLKKHMTQALRQEINTQKAGIAHEDPQRKIMEGGKRVHGWKTSLHVLAEDAFYKHLEDVNRMKNAQRKIDVTRLAIPEAQQGEIKPATEPQKAVSIPSKRKEEEQAKAQQPVERPKRTPEERRAHMAGLIAGLDQIIADMNGKERGQNKPQPTAEQKLDAALEGLRPATRHQENNQQPQQPQQQQKNQVAQQPVAQPSKLKQKSMAWKQQAKAQAEGLKGQGVQRADQTKNIDPQSGLPGQPSSPGKPGRQ